MKLLSRMQSRAEERTRKPQQPTLSRRTSATPTSVPKTFQQPQQPAPVRNPSTNQRPTRRAFKAAYFYIDPNKALNPLSVTSATGEEDSHNISGLSSFFGNLQSDMSYQQINTPQPFCQVTYINKPPLLKVTILQQEPQPSLSLSSSQPTPSSSSSRTTALGYNRSFSGPLL